MNSVLRSRWSGDGADDRSRQRGLASLRHSLPNSLLAIGPGRADLSGGFGDFSGARQVNGLGFHDWVFRSGSRQIGGLFLRVLV